ncbi:unnamed protein product [Eruca vesicaria subsp. sativa]|uniref:peroxidase n=1 Tax=Eruca vesicaria subsp. sativa TaxID=29727 RepID=A0ABC8M543_ERUVS|nr:unnamed protein product [Eruca vesicaria subsp. sativa]
MASNHLILVIFVTLLLHSNNNTVVEAQLRADFYSKSCPSLFTIVGKALREPIALHRAPSIIRLFYLDCFVNVRVVSCADILAIAARQSVQWYLRSSWELLLGRRDARTASQAAANSSIPLPTSSLTELISIFGKLGFSPRELVALSGAHTIGETSCINVRTRIYNDTNINPSFAADFRKRCPITSIDWRRVPLDYLTPDRFDTGYFNNLMSLTGVLHSDQELFNNGSTDSIDREYSHDVTLFYSDFTAAMLKMSLLSPLTGSDGEIRKSCWKIN